MLRRPTTIRILAVSIALAVAGCSASTSPATSAPGSVDGAGSSVPSAPAIIPPAGMGIHSIQHVIVIMQENRSFDTYFGTYPGADGIPMNGATPSVCVPDPSSRGCDRPYHTNTNAGSGGPHNASNATLDIDGGNMDGFVREAEGAKKGCARTFSPGCAGSGTPDVMGYMDQREIPNYWTWARDYVLQDHMFEPNASWSLPSHLFMVSGWSAKCTNTNDPTSCTSALQSPSLPTAKNPDPYAWTDLTYLLHKDNVSWGYYLSDGTQPDCDDDAMVCPAKAQNAAVPSIWNPLAGFGDVKSDGQTGNIQTIDHFLTSAKDGSLPAVSWVVPNGKVSEHPPSLVSDGQSYVTSLIDAVMTGPDWDSTAIFLAWDDWGGFYDNVTPPAVDGNGYGLRVPGMVISPYSRFGYIDHQTLSFDAYLKFIEDDFLGGQRIDPATDGRPDSRPDVRENAPGLGDLTADFDFNQAPRAGAVLSTTPATDLK